MFLNLHKRLELEKKYYIVQKSKGIESLSQNF